jgi:hypothetical protein
MDWIAAEIGHIARADEIKLMDPGKVARLNPHRRMAADHHFLGLLKLHQPAQRVPEGLTFAHGHAQDEHPPRIARIQSQAERRFRINAHPAPGNIGFHGFAECLQPKDGE